MIFASSIIPSHSKHSIGSSMVPLVVAGICATAGFAVLKVQSKKAEENHWYVFTTSQHCDKFFGP